MSGPPELLAKLDRLVSQSARADTSDFDGNPGAARQPQTYRPAAVLVALMDRGRGPELLLTRRTSNLKHHPGQIAFPGGKVDPNDAGPAAAAIREAEEEIGLAKAQISIVGNLARHRTVTGFEVTPVVAVVDPTFEPVPEPGEVEEVFRVPFDFIMDAAHARLETRHWQGEARSYPVIPYGPYYIWGATARILVSIQPGWALSKCA